MDRKINWKWIFSCVLWGICMVCVVVAPFSLWICGYIFNKNYSDDNLASFFICTGFVMVFIGSALIMFGPYIFYGTEDISGQLIQSKSCLSSSNREREYQLSVPESATNPIIYDYSKSIIHEESGYSQENINKDNFKKKHKYMNRKLQLQ